MSHMRLVLATAVMVVLLGGVARADSEKLCPRKDLDTNTLTGKYMGISEKGGRYSIELSMKGEKDNVQVPTMPKKFYDSFSKRTGDTIEITYVTRQFWGSKNSECIRYDIFTSGKLISKSDIAPDMPVPVRLEEMTITGAPELVSDVGMWWWHMMDKKGKDLTNVGAVWEVERFSTLDACLTEAEKESRQVKISGMADVWKDGEKSFNLELPIECE